MVLIIDFNTKKKEYDEIKKNEEISQELAAKKAADSFVKCACGNVRYHQIFVLKVITPFEDPELTENQVMPIPMFECSNCKKLVNIY